MLDEATRSAILKLHEQGHSRRKIAADLNVARSSVSAVVASRRVEVPALVRSERAEAWRTQILDLHARFEGHLGRIHEALTRKGRRCRMRRSPGSVRHGIGHSPKLLKSLRLHSIAERFDEIAGDAETQGQSFASVLTRLLRAEWHSRQ